MDCYIYFVDIFVLVKVMGWEMVVKEFDEVLRVGVVIFKKFVNNSVYESCEVVEFIICVVEDNGDVVW